LDEGAVEERAAEVLTGVVRRHRPSYGPADYRADRGAAVAAFAPQRRRAVLWRACGEDPALFDRWWAEFLREWKRLEAGPVLMPKVGPELRALALRYRLVLAGPSGQPVLDLLAREGLLDLFENTLTRDEVALAPADPAYLLQIGQRAQLRAAEVVVVGNRLDRDVVPARMNGMGTVFLRTGEGRDQRPRSPDEVPDLTLEAVEGLAAAVAARFGGGSGR